MRPTKWLFLALCLMLSAFAALAQDGVSNNSVSFNGISFSASSELGAHVNIWNFAGDPVDLEQPGGPQPPHTAFYLYDDPVNDYGTAAANASVTVYSAAALSGYPFYQAELARLEEILLNQPDLSGYEVSDLEAADNSGTLPFLPVYPAAQVIRAGTGYIQTPAMSGIRYITVYRQDASPFVADEFIYTIQGLSSDGQYYISLIQQVDIASFPATLDSVNLDEFMATIDEYMNESIRQINEAGSDQINPPTTLLDDLAATLLIGTLDVTTPPDAVSTIPVEPTATAMVNTDPTLGGLAGAWNVVSYGAADSPITVIADVPATVEFSATGVSGTAGCNQFSGGFTYENNTLTVTPLVSTRMACEEGIMTQESAVMNALMGAQTFTLAGDTLTINYTLADGTTGVLTLARMTVS